VQSGRRDVATGLDHLVAPPPSFLTKKGGGEKKIAKSDHGAMKAASAAPSSPISVYTHRKLGRIT